MKKALVLTTTDSMIWNFLIPHIQEMEREGISVECACSKTGKYFDELKDKYKIKINKIDFVRNPYSLKNIKAYKYLDKLVKRRKYDIIFCHEPIGGLMGRLIGHKYNIKVIYMAHGFHFFKGAPLKNWLIYYNIERFLSKFTDTLITINKDDYEIAIKKFKKCKKIEYVHGIGLYTEKFDLEMKEEEKNKLRSDLGLNKDDIVLIFPAELNRNKNQLLLINGMERLIKDNINLKLLLVGNDSYNGYYQKIVKEKKLTNNVKFLGFRDDIPQLMKISNIAVSSSFREGLPVNILEALYSKLPVIATECRGNTDLIENGKNGYIIKQNDINSFVEKVRILSQNKNMCEKYGEYGRKHINKYLLKNVKSEFKKIYNKYNDNDLISVIIPVFNTENYITDCIQSVLNQTYKNIEILLINDGSTDNSSFICDRYKKIDERIKVVHKKNEGISSARNKGIELSNGKYITFVDSDDIIDLNYIETLHNMIIDNNAEISICNSKIFYNTIKAKTTYKRKHDILYNPKEYFKKFLCFKTDFYAWGVLLPKAFIKNINFPINTYYEDLAVMYKIFSQANIIAYNNIKIYKYRQHSNSITQNYSKKKVNDYLNNTFEFLDFIFCKYPELKEYKNQFIMNAYAAALILSIDNHNEREKYEIKINEISKKVKLKNCSLLKFIELNIFKFNSKLAINLLIIRKKFKKNKMGGGKNEQKKNINK